MSSTSYIVITRSESACLGVSYVSPELEFVRRETENVTQSISADDWLRAPAGKWNSLQILEHLVLTYTATTKGLLRTMQTGQPESGEADASATSTAIVCPGNWPFSSGS